MLKLISRDTAGQGQLHGAPCTPPQRGSARHPSGAAKAAPEREEQHRVPGTGSINDESQFETTGRTPALALLVHDPSFREILRCLPLKAPSC